MNFDSSGSDSGKIDGLQTVNFAYDQASIDEAGKATLNGNAEWMKKNKNVIMQIEGHCDARGSVEYNLALGERRAKTVKNYLVTLGVDGARMKIISYGKEKPLVEGDTEDAFSKNRRANFIPLPN
jgi:peptidoglycan-associated lipoprotein